MQNNVKRLLKKQIILAVLLMMAACGNKTNSAATDADSTQVFEVPDTLNSVEAVIQQVDSVYAYWNYQRQNYKEGMPTGAQGCAGRRC